MAIQVQYRRGTAAENNAFTGALGEITVDTTNSTLRVHNGVTAGGSGNLATVAYVTAQISSLSANSISSGTSNVQVVSSGGNVTVSVGGTGNVAVFSSSALTLTGSLLNGQANGVGNIGSATGYFNTIFATATSAQYADLAEKYLSDADYPVGTVLIFGGVEEVTQSKITHDTAIAGTVSERPSYIMNAGLEGTSVVTVALLGRVPCRVVGNIRKGDLLVSSQLPGVATSIESNQYQPGCVIGKALENYNSFNEGLIEIAVGRL